MLRTVEFGTVRIVESVDPRFDTFCGWDLLGEWSFWVLPDGEVVALEEVEQTSSSVAGGPGAVGNRNRVKKFFKKVLTNCSPLFIIQIQGKENGNPKEGDTASVQ